MIAEPVEPAQGDDVSRGDKNGGTPPIEGGDPDPELPIFDQKRKTAEGGGNTFTQGLANRKYKSAVHIRARQDFSQLYVGVHEEAVIGWLLLALAC